MPHDDAVTSWLREQAIPLDPQLGLDEAVAQDDEVLASWAAALARASVVGLGEATHGTAEFVVLKSRLVRWLVERQGFGVLALEAGPTACRAMSAYVVDGVGDARSALRAAGSWVWSTEQLVPLLDRLREHNAGLDPDRRVRIVGLDPVLEQDDVERAADLVADHLPEQLTEVRAALTAIRVAQQSTPPVRTLLREAIRAALPGGAARQRIAGHPLRRAAQVVRAAVRALSERDLTAATPGLDELITAGYAADVEAEATLGARGAAVRDAAMADRTTELLAVPGTRVVVWAHNGHVADADLGRRAPATGRHLRAQLGERYYALGLLFARGCFTALSADASSYGPLGRFCLTEPRRGGLEAQLLAAGGDLLVDLRPARLAPQTALRRWARSRTSMRSYGSTIAWWPVLRRATAPVRPAVQFDGLVLVERSSGTSPIEPEPGVGPSHSDSTG